MRGDTWWHRPTNGATERGSSVIGLVVLTPVVVLLLFFVVAAGRVGVIESKLTTAARSAARAAAQYRSVTAARAAAITITETSLGQLEESCQGGPQVRVLEMNLRPGGKVQIQVSCVVRLSDMTMFGVPGNRTVSADSESVVDRHRSESK
ncbi:MAG: TadE family protein [Acidimicrobiia bacterium]|nr:TadE family protein [Acidimicrobiia bacterium]